MLKGMAVASAGFFLIYYGLNASLGNHALWLAFVSYLALRGMVQAWLIRLRKSN